MSEKIIAIDDLARIQEALKSAMNLLMGIDPSVNVGFKPIVEIVSSTLDGNDYQDKITFTLNGHYKASFCDTGDIFILFENGDPAAHFHHEQMKLTLIKIRKAFLGDFPLHPHEPHLKGVGWQKACSEEEEAKYKELWFREDGLQLCLASVDRN